MNIHMLLGLATAVVLMITIIEIRKQFRFWAERAAISQRFPFFRLRDKVILEIAQGHDPERQRKFYDLVNETIDDLRLFDFSFYSTCMARFLDEVMEEGHKCNFDDEIDEIIERLKKSDLNDFEREFGKLIIEAARQNSFWLRQAMNPIGQFILVNIHFLGAIVRYIKRHPELGERVETMERYCAVNRQLQLA